MMSRGSDDDGYHSMTMIGVSILTAEEGRRPSTVDRAEGDFTVMSAAAAAKIIIQNLNSTHM